MLKVGFIGLGQTSHENVLGYLNSPDAEIVAVCSLDPAEADAWRNRWNLPQARYYADYQEMLQKEALDIVEILTPHHLHCEQAIACARAGVRGISVQKPMGRTLRECHDIIDACRTYGAKLKVYENFLFYPVYVKAKQLIDEGLIGDLLSIRVQTMCGLREGADWPWCFKPGGWRTDLNLAGVGPLVGDDGFHKFSIIRWFMQRDLTEIGAWIEPETPLDAPAFVRARFHRLPGDPPKYGQIDFSYSRRMALPCDFWLDEFLEIVGERGVMWINQCSAAGDREMFRGNEMSKSHIFPPITLFLNGKVTPILADMPLAERNWSSSFIASTQHFIRVMKEGGTPIFSGEDGMEITRYIIATYLSAQEKRDVKISEITLESEAAGRARIRSNFCNLEDPSAQLQEA